MSILEEKEVESANSENIRLLINELVKRFAKNGIYLEVGTFMGSSLLSAALFNPSTLCIGVDNFSEFDPRGTNYQKLKENLAKFDNLSNVEFYNQDYKKAITDIFSLASERRVNIYYYDGPHDYTNQLEGLEEILPYLERKCLIVVDDVNYDTANRANNKFIKRHKDFKLAFRIRTKHNGSSGWWNGFAIITRGI